MSDFNAILRRLRTNAGYENAKDFAIAIGIPYTTYITYEKNSEAKGDTLIKLATFLHVTTDELLGYEVNKQDVFDVLRNRLEKLGCTVTLRPNGEVYFDYPTEPFGEEIYEYTFYSKENFILELTKAINKADRETDKILLRIIDDMVMAKLEFVDLLAQIGETEESINYYPPADKTINSTTSKQKFNSIKDFLLHAQKLAELQQDKEKAPASEAAADKG